MLFSFGTGERLEPEQVEILFADCMGEENDDGEIKYVRKYREEIPFICSICSVKIYFRNQKKSQIFWHKKLKYFLFSFLFYVHLPFLCFLLNVIMNNLCVNM